MEKQIVVHSRKATDELAKRLSVLITPHTLITLSGDLGAGKTTFTKSLGTYLGVTRNINSPTFNILKIYQGIMPFYHIDAYRLEGIDQELGFEEVFDDAGICMVEWPHYIEKQLPKERLEISITRCEREEERIFTFVSHGRKYEDMLEELV